ncbi:hypothetical protein, partial [Salmonella enterica]|uniref:hypothetical protein n=1 Tax=Salmonella enterica TaxID=28901 RepID=UPI00398C508A
GLPVMVWGIIGDTLMVTDDTRSLFLAFALITLAVTVLPLVDLSLNALHSLLRGPSPPLTLVRRAPAPTQLNTPVPGS